MKRWTKRSRLDAISLVILVVGAVLFVLSAGFFLASVLMIELNDGIVPRFTLGEIATFLGLCGMVIVPLFIPATILAGVRERRKQTGNEIDDQAQQRAAGRRGPDGEDQRADLHHGPSRYRQDGSAESIRQDYEEEARGRGIHGHRRS